jgi:hypothetical protein
MKDDQRHFLGLLGQPPARLTAEQVAWVLQCQPTDVATLIGARLLKPLGDPSPNGAKFFATRELLELLEDRNWLNRVTLTLQQYWLGKNERRAKPIFSARPAVSMGGSKRMTQPEDKLAIQ